MGFADFYFERQKNFKVKIQEQPRSDLKYIVVIPCYNEFNLFDTLNSIWNADSIDQAIEIIIVVNSSETTNQEIKDQNKKTYNEVKSWTDKHNDSLLRFFVLLEEDLPRKFAGAGLARKIGMDQAITRFNKINNSSGIILSMDADSTIQANYFVEIDKHMNQHPKTNTFTTYFEHSISGNEFKPEIYRAISMYELYLRYYKLALDYSGFPYSYYTIGSCFGVRAQAYVKQGGMNRKQAGEDFYFLHKIFPLANAYEVNTTSVYPSSRPSDRVPFGTGPMIQSIVKSSDDMFLTYNLKSFKNLKIFFDQVDDLFNINQLDVNNFFSKIPEPVVEFLKQNDFSVAIDEINQNSSSIKTFTKRFYNWFDAFRVLKYLNFSHEKFYEKRDLLKVATELFYLITNKKLMEVSCKNLLEKYRSLERQF